jgi:hypothetical protein
MQSSEELEAWVTAVISTAQQRSNSCPVSSRVKGWARRVRPQRARRPPQPSPPYPVMQSRLGGGCRPGAPWAERALLARPCGLVGCNRHPRTLGVSGSACLTAIRRCAQQRPLLGERVRRPLRQPEPGRQHPGDSREPGKRAPGSVSRASHRQPQAVAVQPVPLHAYVRQQAVLALPRRAVA